MAASTGVPMRRLLPPLAIAFVFFLIPPLLAGKTKGCGITTLGACPTRGCEKAGTAKALSNVLKHNLHPKGDARLLSFDDLLSLQDEVDELFGDDGYAELTKPERARLRKLHYSDGIVGEGDLVEVIGYISVKPEKTKPHANASGESVNCKLTGSDNNDFHISVAEKSGGSEFGGIVVEMIPQRRNDAWTASQLQKVQKARLQVRVRGQLFFDNHHRVNKNAGHPIGGQPKRASLWEIHPVTQFDVCTKTACAADSPHWTPLEDWE